MDGREGMSSSGVTVVGSDAPSDYHIAPRTYSSSQFAGSSSPAAVQAKKKRGRPRKYGSDGAVTGALSPNPISTSPPPVVDFSSVGKRGKVRGLREARKQQQPKYESGNSVDGVACSVGANFTPHIITVNSSEDVTMKVISFSQQGPRAICILSASGVISSVTLRQPDSSGGTLTYEGRFEILSLSGSFVPTDGGEIRSRSGGMSVSLASPDGRVVGGGVAGLLVAATPVQVVVGSFLAGNQQVEKAKKKKGECYSTVTATAVVPATPRTNFSSSSSFRGDNWSLLPLDSRNGQADFNVTLPGG